MDNFRIEINKDKNDNITIETFKQRSGGIIHDKITVTNYKELQKIKEEIKNYILMT